MINFCSLLTSSSFADVFQYVRVGVAKLKNKCVAFIEFCQENDETRNVA